MHLCCCSHSPRYGRDGQQSDAVSSKYLPPLNPYLLSGGTTLSVNPKKHSNCPRRIQCHPSHSQIFFLSSLEGNSHKSSQHLSDKIISRHFLSGGISTQNSRQKGNVSVMKYLHEIEKLNENRISVFFEGLAKVISAKSELDKINEKAEQELEALHMNS